MKRKLTILAMALAAVLTSAAADIAFTYDDAQFDIVRNETKMLTVNLEGAESVIGFQTDVVLPAGLSIVSNADGLDITLGNGKKASHVVQAEKVSGVNTYRIVVYSSKNEAFANGNGLLNINIKSDNSLDGGDIKICKSLCSLKGNQSQKPADLTIHVGSFVGVASIAVTPANASVNLGKTLQLTATVSPANAWEKDVTWSSSNTKVATVDANGVVTPVAKGTVTITAKATDGTNVTGSATVTVTNYAQTFTLGEESLSIEEDETLQLNPVFTPANAEELGLTWTTTDEAIAYVDAQNVLHALTPGQVTVTAYNAASGLSASIAVTVTPVLYGDANNDNKVAINDAVTEARYILERDPQPFNFKKADVNRDREINILDITGTVDIILANSSQTTGRRQAPANASPMAWASQRIDGDDRVLVINLRDVQDITAMQADIELPEGLAVKDIRIANGQTRGFVVSYASEGNWARLAAYSLSLACMRPNSPAIEIVLAGEPLEGENAVIYNVLASDTDSRLTRYSDMVASSETDGVESVEADAIAWPADVYNMTGVCVKRAATSADLDALAPGIYIANGQKLLVK